MRDASLISVDFAVAVVPVVASDAAEAVVAPAAAALCAAVTRAAVVAEAVVTAAVCPLPPPAQDARHAARARHRKIIANFFIIKVKIPFLVFLIYIIYHILRILQ